MISSIPCAILPPLDHSQQQSQLLHAPRSMTLPPVTPMCPNHHLPPHDSPTTKASIADPTADPVVEGSNVPDSRKANALEIDIANAVGITMIPGISKSVKTISLSGNQPAGHVAVANSPPESAAAD